MTHKPFLIALSLFAGIMLLQAACNENKQPDDETKEEVINSGEQMTQKLTGALMSRLSSEIRENGVAGAVRFCSVNAIPLTDSVSESTEAEINRVSHLNRNPENAANTRELEIIEMYLQQMEETAPLDPVVISEEQQYIYYSPILISMPTCLKCHGKPGEDISPEVVQVLDEKYPEDKATGFEMGELRGLFKVAFNKEDFGQ